MKLEIYFPSSVRTLKILYSLLTSLVSAFALVHSHSEEIPLLKSNCLEHREKRCNCASALQGDSCSLTEGNQQSLRERQGNTILLKSRGLQLALTIFSVTKVRDKMYLFSYFFHVFDTS